MLTSNDWQNLVEALDISFQPIVSVHTGGTYAFEALARRTESCGFPTVHALLESAAASSDLFRVDTLLRELALHKFGASNLGSRCHLFLNIDSRSLDHGAELANVLSSQAQRCRLDPSTIVCEIAERSAAGFSAERTAAVLALKNRGFKLALDGLVGPQLWYGTEPEYIKISRAFLADALRDARRKLFVSSVANLAHRLGSRVVGEGLETEHEYFSARELGCDLVQGHLIQPPLSDLAQAQQVYPRIEALNASDRRRAAADPTLILQHSVPIPALRDDVHLADALEAFRLHPGHAFFPVVNAFNQPLGLVRESQLKRYAGNQHLRSQPQKQTLRSLPAELIERCPIADASTPLDRILDRFTPGAACEGLLVVQDLRYVGFLSAAAMLRVLQDKTLRATRDQHPLTRLPGTFPVCEYLAHAVSDLHHGFTLVSFGFCHFKPFNETCGFRKGDRAITLFAELLRKTFPLEDAFIGHVGGGDFFLGLRQPFDPALPGVIAALLADFGSGVEALCEGTVSGPHGQRVLRVQDRSGAPRELPLLSACAAILELPRNLSRPSPDALTPQTQALLRCAKKSPERLAAASLLGTPLPALPPTIFIPPSQNPALKDKVSAHRTTAAALGIKLDGLFGTEGSSAALAASAGPAAPDQSAPPA